jgi:nicotinate phosphoribosyltransferase
VRIDSGDLPIEVAKARLLLDQLGATETKITVTNDLNEYAIASLASAPVDSYGVGTSVVTGSGVAAAGFVYKMVAYQNESGEWLTVSKQSAKKSNLGGKKFAIRRHNESFVATTEVVGTGSAPLGQRGDRNLLVQLVTDGVPERQYQGASGVELARVHHQKAKADLPASALRLTKGEPAIQTLFV